MTGGNIFADAVDFGRKLEKLIEEDFLIPQNKINQLIAYKHLLTNNPKRDILNALQTGSGVRTQPTKTQLGNGLGTILATIGIPLAVEAIKKLTGKGAPLVGSYQKQDGHRALRLGVHQPSPLAAIKKRTRGKGLLLGPSSPFKNIPVLGIIV